MLFAKGATLQVILISVLMGVAMVHLGERRKPRSAGLSFNPCATVNDEEAWRRPGSGMAFCSCIS
jgi:Na+/H+-dicarboxylate symporter